MPNWCNNGITLSHEDPEMIQRAAKALQEGTFLNEFIPVPECLKIVSGRVGIDGSPEQLALEQSQQDNLNNHNYKDWYDFCVNEWGTKWDVQSDSVAIENDNTVSASFDSAWAPPVRAYEQMTEMGFEIIAYYYEPGMGFVGKWDNGIDEFYEYGGETSETVRDVIGEELDDYFCISESMAEWEEENQEIDLDGGLSAVNEQEKE
jgi:hypothetical protein